MLGSVPAIAFIEPDRRHIAACTLLPEFRLNTRSAQAERMARTWRPEVDNTPLGPMVPPTISAPRTLHERSHLDEAEQAWHDVESYKRRFPHEVNLTRRAPIGTAPVFAGPSPTLNRLSEIDWLARTQNLEIATLEQEIGATRISSSFNDDDDDGVDVADDLVEKHASRYGTAYDVPEQGLLDRIEWEQFVLACGPVFKFFLDINPAGRTEVRCNDARVMARPEHLAKFTKPLISLMDGRSMADLANDRERSHYYQRAVWAAMTPIQQHAWTQKSPTVKRYLDPADPDHEAIDLFQNDRPLIRASDGGPSELNLHEVDEEGAVTFEPTETLLTTWADEIPSVQAFV